jgi:hypothetical protein
MGALAEERIARRPTLEKNLTLLADFEQTFRAILADTPHRFEAISVSRSPVQFDKPSVTFCFEDAQSLGMFAFWTSGECDMEIMDCETEGRLLYKYAQVSNSADFADEVRAFLAVMLQRQQP